MNLEIKTEDLQKYSIFVGTPMYGGNCAGLYTKSCTDLATTCAKYGIEVQFFYLFNESLVQRARNYVVDEFMRSNCTHLMFIDSDIGFKANDVLSLLGIQISHPEEYDILAGPYPKKTIAWEKVKTAVENGRAENPFHLEYYTADFVFNAKEKNKSYSIDSPIEVKEAGTGFMLIPRSSLEKYSEAYPELKYRPDHVRTENFDGTNEITAYFDCEIDKESKRYLSEDYFFCKKSFEIGIKIHICPWMELQHVGSYVFKGSMPALASINSTPTSNELSNSKNYKKIKKAKGDK